MSKFRSFLLPVTLVLVVLAALALTSPVHAQDVEPPAEQPVETPVEEEEAVPPIEEAPVTAEGDTPPVPDATEALPAEIPAPEDVIPETVETLSEFQCRADR